MVHIETRQKQDFTDRSIIVSPDAIDTIASTNAYKLT